MTERQKNRNRILSLILSLMIVLGMIPFAGVTASAASVSVYDGTPVKPMKITSSNYSTAFGLTESNWGGYNGWYGIRTAAELYGFAELVNSGERYASAVLLHDVALNAGTITENGSSSGQTYYWPMIGVGSNTFLGKFDGNGCTISGVYCITSACAGLFQGIGKNNTNTSVTVKNIILKNSYINSGQYIGGIVAVAYGYGASISNCKICEDVTICKNTDGRTPYIGGIIGYYSGLSSVTLYKYAVVCSVSNCVNLGTVQNAAVGFEHSFLKSTAEAPAFMYFGAITGAYAEQDNAFEFIPVSNCYYIKGRMVDCNGRSVDANGKTFTCGKGGTYNRRSNTGCTDLSSTSDSHTCVPVTHKEVKATCLCTGLSEYSFCLVCGKITSGTKTETVGYAHKYTTATCVDKARCVYCCTTKGDYDRNNHIGTASVYKFRSKSQHDLCWSCCDAIKETVRHSFDVNGYCLACDHECDHSYIKNKVCQYCGISGTMYLNPVWNSSENKMDYKTAITDGILPALTGGEEKTITEGWYIVENDITINKITISGTVNLVLKNGSKFTFDQIKLNDGNALNIYAQSLSPSLAGVFQASDSNDYFYRIGNDSGVEGCHPGPLTINGGIINVIGSKLYSSSIAIGSYRYVRTGGTVTVNGGILTTSGQTTAIGGTHAPGWLNFNGGIILASGINASKSYKYGIVFIGNGGNICGSSYTLEHDFTIPSGKTLTIEEGKTLTVAEGTTLTIEGRVVKKGKIVNHGTIICKSGHTYVSDCDEICDICLEKRTPTSDHTYESSCAEECKLCGAHRNNSIQHDYENGICQNCGEYQPAVWNSSEKHYGISNAGQLMWFSHLVNGTLTDGTKQNQSANAILMNNIDMTDVTGYIPIGTTRLYYSAEGTDKGYSGTFDGDGYVINDLTFTGSDSAELTYGIFGTLSGKVKNLGVENLNFTRGNADCRAGGIVGQIITGGSVTDCYAANSAIDANGKVAGGLAGCNYAGTIENCHIYNVSVTASRAGGIVGDNRGDASNTDRLGTVSDCYTTASNIQNSERTGNVSGCTTNISDTDFSSGKITWLLNGETANGIWKQTLNEDAYPNFAGGTVYPSRNGCSEIISGFTNTEQTIIPHTFDDNGFCYGTTGEVHYKPAEWDGSRKAYKIAQLSDLLWFGDYVNNGNNKVDAVLTADIDAKKDVAKTIGIGTANCSYEGVFDGNGKTIDIKIESTSDYTALFNYVNGATIKDLTVKGTIATSKKFAASIVGMSTGTTTVEKCLSYVTINSTVNGDGTHGGLVANVSGGTMTINNCGFAGAINGSDTNNCGGFVGWSNGTTAVNNSFVAATFGVKSEGGCTFSRNEGKVTVTNCYYLNSMGTVQGTRITNIQSENGELTWLLNGSKSEGVWKQTIGTDVYPNFTGKTVYQNDGLPKYLNYKCSVHNYNEDGFCTVCGAYQPAEKNAEGYYEIFNISQLLWFEDKVKTGETAINGKLMANIDVSSIENFFIGSSNKKYSGIFDGNGYTLNIKVNGSDSVALFPYVNGATVKNLTVKGNVTASGKYAASIIGQAEGNVTLENCMSEVIITSTVNGDGTHGGLVGIVNSGGTLNINNCGFIGEINGSNTNNCGGLLGWSNGTTAINNSFVSATFGIKEDGGSTIARNESKVTITNCYYLNSMGTVQGTQVILNQVENGELTWLLNGSKSEGVWKQTIGTDIHPNFKGKSVYRNDGYPKYLNYECAAHSYNNNGFCTKCGAYEPAVLNDGIYEISNAGQLFWFAAYVNDGNGSANALLIKDIDLENRLWTPIGRFSDYKPYSSDIIKYEGTFDGGNHIISNLNVKVTNTYEAGLFSRTYGATLKNFGVVNVKVESTQGIRVGVLAGEIHNSTVENVFTAGDITVATSHDQAGGIAGECVGSALTNCFTAYGTLCAVAGTVTNCFYMSSGVNSASVGQNKTAKQFASGEIAWLLNGNSSEGVWKQTINTDAYPKFTGGTVYRTSPCPVCYTNDQNATVKEHNYKYGVCTDCDECMELVLNADKYYEIDTVEKLFTFAAQVNMGKTGINAKLTKNIDLTGYTWTPIGKSDKIYKGTFDGNNKTISGMTLTADRNNQGLFGVVGGATLKNFTVKGNITVSATETTLVECIGGVAGTAGSSSVIDGVKSYVNFTDAGTVLNGNTRQIGGIVGYLESSTVKNCMNYGNMAMQLGRVSAGIAGLAATNSTVADCENRGNIIFTGDAHHIGGVVGSAQTGTAINRCINYGNVSSGGTDCLGGITGYANNGVKFDNCANNGTVTCTANGHGFAGGILGYVNNSKFGGITNCYNYGSIVTNEGCAEKAGAILGNNKNSGNVYKNNYYLKDSCGAAYGSAGKAVAATQKNAEQFASGEVAFLLQSANGSTLVWGQISSEDGATPVLTSNEDYRVIPVKSGDTTVNYSVLKAGETNGDGVIDVYDYQNAVNIALSENNEKEIAEKYDLNQDGVIDVADCVTAQRNNMSDSDYAKLLEKAEDFEGMCYMKAADFNNDGVVDILDIALFEKLMSGHRVEVKG